MKLQNKALWADAAILLTAIIWGSAFVVLKSALDYVTPIYLMAFRFSLAALGMGLIFHKRLANVDKATLCRGAVLGVALALGYGIQTVGLQYTTAGKNAFLTSVYVVLVPFLYWVFYRKRPTAYNLAAAVLCLLGVGFLSLGEGFTMGLGDALSLLCGVFYGVHIVLLSRYAQNSDNFSLTTIQFGVAAVLFWIYAGLFEPFPRELGWPAVGGILYVTVFSTMVALSLQTIGQKYTSASHASILMSTEALFGTLFGILILGERFTAQTALGCGLIFLAVLTSETEWSFFRRKPSDPLPPPFDE